MMKVIVTGAAGNLGKRILEQGRFDCVSVSRVDWQRLDSVARGECQALIHCAYDLKSDINERPDDVLQSNILSTATALRVCREKALGKFVFISSCSVYGDSSNTTEGRICQPVTINGHIKLFNEELVTSFCRGNGISYLILRVFNSYGGDDSFSVVQKLVACARQHRPFELVNEGMAERDFIHVRDVARIVCELTAMDVSNEVINVGTGRSVRVADLLRAVENRFGPIELARVARDDEVIYSRANVEKLTRLLPPHAGDIFDFIRSLE